mmetsp:Transcript_73779/g.144297  ORF Transcript_73779/g.144297 Transcript_73779/m.144297 type:complete len:81 (-) Transcript_73779:197-439(-)
MYPVLTAAWLWSLCFDRTQRKAVDWVVHVWAKASMLACLCPSWKSPLYSVSIMAVRCVWQWGMWQLGVSGSGSWDMCSCS